MDSSVYDYITTEENAYKTIKVPLTNSKEWNMSEHIERCYNVANGWFHSGKNDDKRPYDDIATPIIDVAFRSENFDVKDITPYVDDVEQNYKSFIIKSYHPIFATESKLDDFIDEVIETSIVYDLVLFQIIEDEILPKVVPLQQIAFCDQTDVLSGSICIKHEYTISDLLEMKGLWDDAKIDEAIVLSQQNKSVAMTNGKKAKTTGKYIEIYELHGLFPETWLDSEGSKDKYKNQLHIVCFYLDEKGNKNGLTLFKGKNKPIKQRFKALKIDKVRSFGRACGRSVVERLFQPVLWNNYSGLRIKQMLDVASMILAQSSSQDINSVKRDEIAGFTLLKSDQPINRIDTNTSGNLSEFVNHKSSMEKSARMLGSASEGQLGVNPSSGTPFALESLVVQQGEGMHEYRRGKVATFFAEELYPDVILKGIIKKINSGIEFSQDLSLSERQEIAEKIATNKVEGMKRGGKILFQEDAEEEKQKIIAEIMKKDSKFFIKSIKDELKDVPVKVKINIAGKQKYLAQNADKLSKLISNILGNYQAFATIPGLGNVYNQLIESSGLSPIDFSQITKAVPADVKTTKLNSPVSEQDLSKETVLS